MSPRPLRIPALPRLPPALEHHRHGVAATPPGECGWRELRLAVLNFFHLGVLNFHLDRGLVALGHGPPATRTYVLGGRPYTCSPEGVNIAKKSRPRRPSRRRIKNGGRMRVAGLAGPSGG